MNGSALHIKLSYADGFAFLTVEGDIDAHSVAELCEVLESLPVDRHAIVDMAAVRFMDSSGINALIEHTVRIEGTGGSLRVSNPSTPVQRVMELTGLAHLFLSPRTDYPEASGQCLGTNGVGTT